MGRIGLSEILLILIVAVLLFGPSKLPDIGRALGRAVREFKDAMNGGSCDKPEDPSGGKK